MKMKVFRLCAIFLASMVSVSAMAQENATMAKVPIDLSVGIGVAPRTMLNKGADDRSMFGIDVTFAGSLVYENNLEGEAEFTLRYNMDKKEDATGTNKLELNSFLMVPSVGYHIDIPNTKFSVTPMVGLFFDNVMGAKSKFTPKGSTKTSTIDLTDMDDVRNAGIDDTWSMALGLEGALKFRFSDKFYMKARYGHTFLKYNKDTGYSYWGIMAAYVFRL